MHESHCAVTTAIVRTHTTPHRFTALMCSCRCSHAKSKPQAMMQPDCLPLVRLVPATTVCKPLLLRARTVSTDTSTALRAYTVQLRHQSQPLPQPSTS